MQHTTHVITIFRMNILQIAIDKEGGVTRLAEKLGTKQNVISNWRARGVPLAWRKLLELAYKKEARKAAQ